MKLLYKIFYYPTNRHLANIYYDKDLDKYEAEIVDYDFDNYPSIFWKVSDGFTHINQKGKPHPESQYILNFLRDRVIPENRDNIKELLLQNGLYEYDWRELIKLNHGKTVDDEFSVEYVG